VPGDRSQRPPLRLRGIVFDGGAPLGDEFVLSGDDLSHVVQTLRTLAEILAVVIVLIAADGTKLDPADMHNAVGGDGAVRAEEGCSPAGALRVLAPDTKRPKSAR
jgi:hypothetical protein